MLLVETARRTGLDTSLSAALEPWRRPRAVHDPGKVLLDLALAVALGGDCLSDVGMLRAEPAVFGLASTGKRSCMHGPDLALHGTPARPVTAP